MCHMSCPLQECLLPSVTWCIKQWMALSYFLIVFVLVVKNSICSWKQFFAALFFFPLLNIKQILYTSAKTKEKKIKKDKKLKVLNKGKKRFRPPSLRSHFALTSVIQHPQGFKWLFHSLYHDLEGSRLSPSSFIHLNPFLFTSTLFIP